MSDDDIGMYRHDASDTMMDGAWAIGPEVKSIRARVEYILRCSPGGLTQWELHRIYVRRFGDKLYRTVGARCRELVLDGRVRDSGRRRDGPSGVSNAVWEIVPKVEQLSLPLVATA